MVEAGLRPKTIQDAKLAPVRAILEWGVNNKHLASNPADGISLDVRSKQGEKKRSFTDEEAKIILKAALAEKDPVRHWVPWLGAYSGARVSELCQLRVEDIIKIDTISTRGQAHLRQAAPSELSRSIPSSWIAIF
jgi:integrase